MEEQEICRRVWPEWELPLISHGLSYSDACARHVKEEFGASQVYIIVSKSLTYSSDHLQRLKNAIGEANIAYVRVGMKPHSMYSEVLEIASDLRKLEADCLVTLGGGSIIDGAKGAILVSLRENARYRYCDGIKCP